MRNNTKKIATALALTASTTQVPHNDFKNEKPADGTSPSDHGIVVEIDGLTTRVTFGAQSQFGHLVESVAGYPFARKKHRVTGHQQTEVYSLADRKKLFDLLSKTYDLI